jgi:hypothetical protein
MPNRILRDGILTSEKVDQLDPPAEVFYRRLINVVDDFGRYDARPSILKAHCFPLRLDTVREADISRWIAECEKAGLLALYEVDGKPYLEVFNVGPARAKHSRYPARPCAQMIASASIGMQTQASVPYSYSDSYSDSTTDSGGSLEEARAKAEADARSFATGWISANYPSHLRSGAKPFAAVVLAWGKERAVSEVEKAMKDGSVRNAFHYVEGIANGEERDRAAKPKHKPMVTAVREDN